MSSLDKITVLVVDDEPLVRLVAVDLLEDAGFAVVEAADAEEALIRLDEHPEVRVLFTDINMPGPFDGLELAIRVHAKRPDVQVIVTSGRFHLGRDDVPFGDFVPKPYGIAAVTRMIHDARH